MSSGIFSQYTGYHNRRTVRLRGHDYAKPGYYFVTICINDHAQKYFGDVADGKMVENEYARIIRNCWNDLQNHYPLIRLDEFVVMPNHVHGIIVITESVFASRRDAINRVPTISPNHVPTTSGGATGSRNPMLAPDSLSNIIRRFKGQTTFAINKLENKKHFKWQQRFYDHIIRDEKSLFLIRKYIRQNPVVWAKDPENHIRCELQ